MHRPLLVLTGALVSLSSASAQEPPYIDDRSEAAALVRSLYNAINRKEYARAWSYFGESKPASTYEDFAEGYARTEAVEVVIGPVTTEGAAGSIYSRIPVAILATAGDGGRLFAGCYTTRLANPRLQAPPFQPLHIESGALRPATGTLDEALPAACDGK